VQQFESISNCCRPTAAFEDAAVDSITLIIYFFFRFYFVNYLKGFSLNTQKNVYIKGIIILYKFGIFITKS